MKHKITIKNVWYYLQGNLRYKLYYSRFKKLIRKHILEQIEFRINSMDKFCYNNGSCKLCGCKTTALQMANKACDKPCYPKMLSKKDWNSWKKIKDTKYFGQTFYTNDSISVSWTLDLEESKFKMIKYRKI